MFCPNCGQQQISEEMRFCSRCGLSFTGLAEWLAGGGVPANRTQKEPVEASSPRRKGNRRPAKLMFVSGALFPIFLVGCLAADEGGPMIIPITLFLVSLGWMFYRRLFGETNVPATIQAAPQTSALGSTATRGTLPPGNTVVMPGRQQVRTNELAQPPSVTEHTTRLLDNE